MQDNPSTDNQDDTGGNTPYFEMDREDWELAFEAFKDTGYTAIKMGQNLRMLYKYLDTQLFKPRPVMEALDLAMEVLFPLTEFHKTTFHMIKSKFGQRLGIETNFSSEEAAWNALA